jgi:hypothetical protein
MIIGEQNLDRHALPPKHGSWEEPARNVLYTLWKTLGIPNLKNLHSNCLSSLEEHSGLSWRTLQHPAHLRSALSGRFGTLVTPEIKPGSLGQDEPNVRELRRVLLKRFGYPAIVAASGQQAPEIFTSTVANAIILDYRINSPRAPSSKAGESTLTGVRKAKSHGYAFPHGSLCVSDSRHLSLV